MQNEFEQPWYHLDWFAPSTLSAHEWVNKPLLYVALAMPLIFLLLWLIRQRRNQKLPVAVVKRDLRNSSLSVLRFVPDVLLMLTMALIVVALARPQRSNEKSEQWTEGIDIMIGLDISQSMEIQDFEPNRLLSISSTAGTRTGLDSSYFQGMRFRFPH
jgi:Ca-activated chloride channel homolog